MLLIVKAAKGGEAIPADPPVRSIAGLSTLLDAEQLLEANPEPGRPYPWGEAPDPERMNFAMNIGRVAPLGCYPSGCSPYGCEELAGNVLDWTRSRNAAYPYPEDPTGRAGQEAPGPAGRGLRGGAFDSLPGSARCSARGGSGPVSRRDDVGFRLVLAPCL
jgi:formylglycine-generating enzyme required for sulfatase activity